MIFHVAGQREEVSNSQLFIIINEQLLERKRDAKLTILLSSRSAFDPNDLLPQLS